MRSSSVEMRLQPEGPQPMPPDFPLASRPPPLETPRSDPASRILVDFEKPSQSAAFPTSGRAFCERPIVRSTHECASRAFPAVWLCESKPRTAVDRWARGSEKNPTPFDWLSALGAHSPAVPEYSVSARTCSQSAPLPGRLGRAGRPL